MLLGIIHRAKRPEVLNMQQHMVLYNTRIALRCPWTTKKLPHVPLCNLGSSAINSIGEGPFLCNIRTVRVADTLPYMAAATRLFVAMSCRSMHSPSCSLFQNDAPSCMSSCSIILGFRFIQWPVLRMCMGRDQKQGAGLIHSLTGSWRANHTKL
jgi:hypothetical protein